MTKETLQDKGRGSLIGGAIGDALGYAVEFMSLPEIRAKYGQAGITGYDTQHYREEDVEEEVQDNVAVFSDDTQMTLFTAQGLLSAIMAERISEYAQCDIDTTRVVEFITRAYLHWLDTQYKSQCKVSESWLSSFSQLWERRAPGMTCLMALKSISDNKRVFNHSKGCGGIMRIAPLAIFASSQPEIMSQDMAAYIAGEVSAITHKHPTSTLSAIGLSIIISECMKREHTDRDTFCQILTDKMLPVMRSCAPQMHFRGNEFMEQMEQLVIKAMLLSTSEISDHEGIHSLGEGWTAEETLAIAIFSVLRHIDDFAQCITCAVNHNGDSDSTGEVAGNIIGAILGYSAIPQQYIRNLELGDLILSVADDLCGCSSVDQLAARYGNPDYEGHETFCQKSAATGNHGSSDEILSVSSRQ